MKSLKSKLETLCVFRQFLTDPVITSLCGYLGAPTNAAYAAFVAALYEVNGGNITEYIQHYLAFLKKENPYEIRNSSHSKYKP